MAQSNNESVKACMRVFVTWRWMLGILTGSMLAVATLAWTGSERIANIDSSIQTLQEDVDQLNGMDNKLDTLLIRTRK